MASVRTEVFVTVVVPESRLAKHAKESGGGFEGRAAVLTALTGEVEAHLRGGLGMSAVSWLTSPEHRGMPHRVRARRPGRDHRRLAAAATNPGVNARAMGDGRPVRGGSDPAALQPRRVELGLSHDPPAGQGAVIGALAPVPRTGGAAFVHGLLPDHLRARREPALRQQRVEADMADGLRAKAKVKQRTRSADEADKIRGLDRKLSRGNALTRPHAVATVTVPKTAAVTEHGRGLDAAIRSAGFAPLRLDLSQDAAFAASTIPLGTSLTARRNR